MRRVGVVLVALLSGACDSPLEPQVVALRLAGTVRSQADGAAIAGATVTLGWGGHFSLPGDLKTTQTGADGRYVIEHGLTYTPPCPFVWVTAAAPGHATSSIEDARHRVACSASQQDITISLKPN